MVAELLLCSLKVVITYSSCRAGSVRTDCRALGFSLWLEDGRRSKTREMRRKRPVSE